MLRLLSVIYLTSSFLPSAFAVEPPSLRSIFHNDFLIGVAVDAKIVSSQGLEGALAARQFSVLTPCNDMKWQFIHPQPDRYQFEVPDATVKFAEKNQMQVIGHTLVWHSQLAPWVMEGKNGNPPTREDLISRMREHIHTVVGRYKGRIKGWDVVNEALSDNGEDLLRDSPWRRIIGDDYIELAFRFAHEADPAAELYYNDYGLESDRKRGNCIKLVQELLAKGVPIHGIGNQSHFHLDYPTLDKIEESIVKLSQTGLKVMISELDVDVLPSREYSEIADVNRRELADPALDPYQSGLPDELQKRLAERYTAIFKIYLKQRKTISRVTFWGLYDGDTWLNGFPIQGRTNHPLLFDRLLKPKPAFYAVCEEGLSWPRK